MAQEKLSVLEMFQKYVQFLFGQTI